MLYMVNLSLRLIGSIYLISNCILMLRTLLICSNFLFGKNNFTPHELPILHYTPMNYHFVINDLLPLVNDIKHDSQHEQCL
jgi:hypothetical protein